MAERGKEQLPEGIFRPVFNFNDHVAMCLQSCYSIQYMRFSDSFTQQILILMQFILPEWEDDKYKKEIKVAKDAKQHSAALFLGAVIRLLHRRQFFEIPDKSDLLG
jgi:hypothetical protein